jgi:hypothetical protein
LDERCFEPEVGTLSKDQLPVGSSVELEWLGIGNLPLVEICGTSQELNRGALEGHATQVIFLLLLLLVVRA